MSDGATMRAVLLRAFGPPEALVGGEAVAPSAGPGEVVIAVALANVTFVETQVRAGRPPHSSMLPALPAILGNGVGGTVAAVGPGVDGALVGRRVIAGLGGTGGYAARAVAAAERVIDVPEGLGLRDAVALLADGRTALGLVELAAPRAGETVLVEAAAGGVGSLLVQAARSAGARVVALAGGEDKLAVARELGAEVAIDYGDADWPAHVRAAVGAVDVVFDGVGGDIGLAAFGLLRAGGRFCPFGMASGRFAPVPRDAALRGAIPSPATQRALTLRALTDAAAGRLRAVVGQEVALEEAAAAHAAIEARATIGKTLLVV